MFPNRLYDTFIPSPFPALVEFPVLSTTTTRTPRDVHRFVVLSRHPFRPSSSLLASLPLPREIDPSNGFRPLANPPRPLLRLFADNFLIN